MNLQSYPDLSGHLAYSIFQWRNLVSPPATEYYLCGKLLPVQSTSEPALGFKLWSQQAEVLIHSQAPWEWDGPEGKWGDWVALKLTREASASLKSADFKSVSGLNTTSINLKRLVSHLPLITEPADIEKLRVRAEFLHTFRQELRTLGLEEIDTPYLVSCPGMEPTLEPFITNWKWGSQTNQVYLPTSPELHLKKMLAQGWTDIFEIKTCFRNSELSNTHEPEFLMLEWYRAFKDLSQIKRDLENLLDAFFDKGFIKGERPRITETTYAELFSEFLNFNLTPQTTQAELEELCKKNNIALSKTDSWDDLFFRLSLDKIEPQLVKLGPLIINNFPPSQVALAKFTSEGWADRFEFYWRGFEIANAFHELNDPVEQERRIQNEIKLRSLLGTAPLKPDQEFIESLKAGMPPSAGIALGVERLLMACQNESRIQSFRAFSFRSF